MTILTTYVISDLHLGHSNTIEKFVREDGSPLRQFKDVEHMNDTIINNINSVVGEQDKLIILGDVVINKKWIPELSRIKCQNMTLVAGNHDVHYDLLQPYFKKIAGCMEYKGSILTHIPVHTSQLSRYKFNIHGHLHDAVVMYWDSFLRQRKQDKRYYNVSVEQLDYTPKPIDTILEELENANQ